MVDGLVAGMYKGFNGWILWLGETMEDIYCELINADNSVQELHQATSHTVLQAFRSFPWKEQAAKSNELDSSVEMSICSGPNAENGDVFIVGYDDGSFLIILKTYKRYNFLGILPREKTAETSIDDADANDVEECIKTFCEYPQQLLFEWIEKKENNKIKMQATLVRNS